MKWKAIVAVGMLTGLFSVTAQSAEVAGGVYVNQDKNPMIKTIAFCGNGKALVEDMVWRSYTKESRDDGDYIILNSNGVFTFKVAADKASLAPADEFTGKWFTHSKLQRDSNKKADCD